MAKKFERDKIFWTGVAAVFLFFVFALAVFLKGGFSRRMEFSDYSLIQPSQIFWLSHVKGEWQNLLESINIVSGKTREWTAIPPQGPNSFGEIPAPSALAGKFAYYKRVGLDWGIYLGNTDGSGEEKVAEGYGCFDGPCDFGKAIFLGELSKNAKYLSFTEGGKSYLRETQTGKRIELSLPEVSESELWPVTFSSAGKYVYFLNKNSLVIAKLGEFSFRRVDFPMEELLEAKFSPDDRYVALTGYGESKIVIEDFEKRKVVGVYDFGETQSGLNSIVWLTNESFVFNANDLDQTGLRLFTFKAGGFVEKKVFDKKVSDLFRVSEDSVLFSLYDEEGEGLFVLDLKSGEVKKVFEMPGFSRGDWFTVLGPAHF